MAKSSNAVGGLLTLPFLLGIYLYFYYYHITVPTTIIIIILIWKRKWISKQFSLISTLSPTSYNNSHSYDYRPDYSYHNVSKNNSYPITPYQLHSPKSTFSTTQKNTKTNTSESIIIPQVSASLITQQPISESSMSIPLVNSNNLISQRPINSIKQSSKTPITFKLNQNISSSNLSIQNNLTTVHVKTNHKSGLKSINLSPKKVVSQKSKSAIKGKLVKKSTAKSKKTSTKINSQVKAKLKKYSLSTNDALILLGKDWEYHLSQPDSSFVWELQGVVAKIKSDPKFRKNIHSFFESTLQLIDDTYKNVPNILQSCDIYFDDIFVWDENIYENSISEIDKFKKSSGKFSKFFDEVNLSQNLSKHSVSVMMQKKDLDIPTALSILGLKPKCNFKQIRFAYREKSLQFHPDRNSSPDSAKMMLEINLAYGYLEKNFKGGKK